MPALHVKIVRAWRHSQDPRRIHYIVEGAGGRRRHLYVDEGSALYAYLDAALLEQGYTMPASASR